MLDNNEVKVDVYHGKGCAFGVIGEWWKHYLTCSVCGTGKSVKYELNDKPVCNACIFRVV